MIIVNNKLLSVESFPNGERRISLPELTIQSDMTTEIIYQYENDGDVLLLNMLDSYIKIKQNEPIIQSTIHCTILSMPYERMDRQESDMVCSLNTIIQLMPKNWHYTILSPHSDATINFFASHVDTPDTLVEQRILPRLLELVSEQLTYSAYTAQESLSDYLFVFPDVGAKNRFTHILTNQFDIPEENILFGKKKRDFATGDIESLHIVDAKGNRITNLKQQPVIVIDDLSSYGGTFIRVESVLNQANAGDRYLVLEKAEDSMFKGFLLNHYKRIFTTNAMMPLPLIPGTDHVTIYPYNVFI